MSNFTFKVSRFSFLPLRVWLSQLELRRLEASLYKHKNAKGHDRFRKMGIYLLETTSSLLKMVRMLWDHFEVPQDDRMEAMGMEADIQDGSVLDNARLNFILLEEYHHYNKKLKREQTNLADEQKHALRLAPAWLRHEQSRLERLKHADKANWKAEWEFDEALNETNIFGAVITRFTLIFQLIAMTAILIIPMLVIMLQPDWCINLIANLLAGLAISLKLPFTTLYASFAVAVFILIVMVIAFIIATLPFKPEPDIMLHDLDERLQDRLSELAYVLTHDIGGEVEHLAENTGSLEIDSLRSALEELTIRNSLS